MTKNRIFANKYGRQSAILDPIFTNIELVRDFMVIKLVTKLEVDTTKNADCTVVTRKVYGRTDGRTPDHGSTSGGTA